MQIKNNVAFNDLTKVFRNRRNFDMCLILKKMKISNDFPLPYLKHFHEQVYCNNTI